MTQLVINRVEEEKPEIGDFLNKEFTEYAIGNHVQLNFDEFCFTAEDEDANIVGVIVGRAYYNEVHIGDLIVDSKYRRTGLGSRLVAAVEEYYSGKGYDKITLTTFGFQAPEFYQKLGYNIEFIREDVDPKLKKYFLIKQVGLKS